MISVSIIVPVYGVEKHIERCLRSVLRQDYQGGLECILVDDCTPDNSMQVVDALLGSYDGDIVFRKLRHEQNRGLSAARNTGTQAATGDYIFYLDSDDEIMPHAISTLVALAEKYPGVDVVYGDWYVSRRYNFLQNDIALKEYINDSNEILSTLLLGCHVSMTAPNKLLKKEFVRGCRLLFKEGVIHEDEHFNYFLAEEASGIAVSFVPTYVYYLNPSGIVRGSNEIRRLESLIILSVDILEHGKTLYRYVFCLRILLFYLVDEMSVDSPLCLQLKEFSRYLSQSAYANHLFVYSFFVYLYAVLPLTWLKYLNKNMLFRKFYSVAWRIIRGKI